MSISPARTAAFDILLRIERERAFSSVLLPLYEERLSPADRSLCHELVLGVLRRQISLDRLLEQMSSGRKLDVEVRVALRLGLYQLRFLTKVPARAAINESVELVKRARKSSASGFVNALLRRSTREEPRIDYADELDRVSIETSHPRWLIEKWLALLGHDDAEVLARSNNEPATTAFRIVGKANEKVSELVKVAVPSESVKGCYRLDRSTPQLRKMAAENRIYLQDEASQLVAHAIIGAANGSFLDVCAAPGGKAGLVASRLRPQIAIAGDLYQGRVELLRGSCRRQNVDVKVVRYDATESLPFAEGTFDAVLVDAPCSGTGTIRHNPEIRYLLSPDDIAELSSKQRRILAEASKAVKKGGLLVYSTCSLESEEGEDVARWFIDEHSGFEKARPQVPERFIDGSGFARTWPQRDDMDGFFIAAFERS